MGKEKIKVYTYTRVSTSMQIDGYSLDAQKSRMKLFNGGEDHNKLKKILKEITDGFAKRYSA